MVVTTSTFSDNVRDFAADRCLLIGRELLSEWVSIHRKELLSRVDVDTLDRFNGRDFEVFVAELLRDRGHSVEIVGGTGDYGADLVVERGGTRTAVQVKRHRQPVSRRAVSDAVAAVEYYECDEAMVVTSAPEFASGARTLAKSAGCELVARSVLEEWLSGFSGSTNIAGEVPFSTPKSLLDYLQWRRALMDASAGVFRIDLAGPQIGVLLSALFLRRVRATATVPYAGVPEGTWLVMKIPHHPKVEWSVRNRTATRSGEVFWLPLDESGTLRLDVKISFSGGLREGLEQSKRTLKEWAIQYPSKFTRGEPGEDQIESVRSLTPEDV